MLQVVPAGPECRQNARARLPRMPRRTRGPRAGVRQCCQRLKEAVGRSRALECPAGEREQQVALRGIGEDVKSGTPPQSGIVVRYIESPKRRPPGTTCA